MNRQAIIDTGKTLFIFLVALLVFFFGRWAWESMKSDPPPVDPPAPETPVEEESPLSGIPGAEELLADPDQIQEQDSSISDKEKKQ